MEKHQLFNDIISDSSHSGLNFERKTLQSKIFTIKQLINECAIYDIVDVTGLVYNLQIEAEHEKDEKTLCIQKVMIKDKTGSTETILFSSLVNQVSKNKSYDFKKMRDQKFMDDRISK